MTQDPLLLAKSIDHTLLKPDATASQFEQLCDEAMEYSFASVCVPPYWVEYCKKKVSNSPALVCTVIGFPLGYHPASSKLNEAESAIRAGADEIDMVLNIAALKNNDIKTLETELSELRSATKGKTLKLILETCYLSENEKELACNLATQHSWDFVKTSTGFGTGGATPEDVQLMYKTVNGKAQVKASGGVINLKKATEMMAAGATRIGTSASVAIVTNQQPSEGNY